MEFKVTHLSVFIKAPATGVLPNQQRTGESGLAHLLSVLYLATTAELEKYLKISENI